MSPDEILLRWQEAGITILAHAPGKTFGPTEIKIQRPSRFRALRYRLLMRMNLRRNSAGGFGGAVPMASSGGGGFA